MPSPYLNTPPRTLEQTLWDLVEAYEALPMTDPKRGDLARRIREVEAAIDARQEL